VASRLLRGKVVNAFSSNSMFDVISKLSAATLLLALLPGCFGVPELMPIPDDESDGETETEGDAEASESAAEGTAGESATDTEGDSDSDSASESVSDTDPSDGSSSTGMGDDGMELLDNGSFESWSSGTPNSWIAGDAVLEELVDDGTDGDRAVRVVSTTYNSIGQFVDMEVPAGSCLAVELSLRWDSGDTVAPVVQLLGRDEASNDVEMFADVEWNSNGEWLETQRSFVTEENWLGVKIGVLSNSAAEQAFALDEVSLAIVPCG
jgi:hypothetical protein